MERLRHNRNVRGACLYGLLSFFSICFIFSQSILSMEDSGDFSAGIMSILKPILDPHGILPEEIFHHYLRKAAHFTEFAVLGWFFSCFTRNLGKFLNREFVALTLLVPLSVAVCDEYLQYFTGRGSAVTDVVIDFCGSICSIFLVWLISYIPSNKKLPQ